MKCTIPEISWHNRDPVLSVDVQPKSTSDNIERLATGGTDSHVVIWHIEVQETGAVKVEFAADLQRHQKAVNVVRFAPSGEFLASGDDESAIIIWKQKTDQDTPELPSGDNDVAMKEQWLGIRVLRGHVEDVYDLSWSPDSNNLISGSVDNSAIIWDVHKGRNLGILKEHKGFVQGVTWDPNNQFVATLSSDRTCRVYNVNSKKLVSRVSKSQLPVPEGSDLHGKVVRLFHDDTLKSFFRRLSFTPDGQLLIVPSGIIENSNSDKNNNATHIFTRHSFNRPAVYLPSNNQYTVAVRCCPLLFELREREPMFALPYRMVIAIATQNSVLLYDTQQSQPFGIVSNIHYTRLTDVTWSSNGRMLIVSSTDGYCSIITFAEGELGTIYESKKNTVNESVEDFEMSDIKNKSPGKDSEDRDVVVESHSAKSKSEITMNGNTSDDCKLHDNEELQKTEETLLSPSKADVKNSSNQSQREENKVGVTESCSNRNISKDNSVNANDVNTIPIQVKTPRRIKPIMLSDPHRKSNIEKSSPSSKNMSSPDVTPKKIQHSLLSEPNKIVMDIKTENNSDEVIRSSDKIEIVKDAVGSIDVEDNDKTNIPSKNISPEKSHNRNDTNSEINMADKLTLTEIKNKDNDNLNSNTGELLKKAGDGEVVESMEIDSDKLNTSKEKILSASPPVSPIPTCITPSGGKRTPRRVQLITLSSPKSKKKLL